MQTGDLPHVFGAAAGLFGPGIADGHFKVLRRRGMLVLNGFEQADVQLRVKQPLILLVRSVVAGLKIFQDLVGIQLSRIHPIDVTQATAIGLVVFEHLLSSGIEAELTRLAQETPQAVLAVDVIGFVILLELSSPLRILAGVVPGEPQSPVPGFEIRLQLQHVLVIGDRLSEVPPKEPLVSAPRVQFHSIGGLGDLTSQLFYFLTESLLIPFLTGCG